MAGDAIINFSNAVLTDAEEKRRSYIEKLNERNAEQLNERKAALHNKYMSKVTASRQSYSEASARNISKRLNDLRRELILRRREMSDDVFAEVRANIEEYTKTADYRAHIVSELKNAAEFIGNLPMICCANAEDIERLKADTAIEKLDFCASETKLIGGFTLSCSEKRLFIDCTLDSRIEKQRELFLINSGLVIE